MARVGPQRHRKKKKCLSIVKLNQTVTMMSVTKLGEVHKPRQKYTVHRLRTGNQKLKIAEAYVTKDVLFSAK